MDKTYVQAIKIISKIQVCQCYIVLGDYVGKVQCLSRLQHYYQQIQLKNLKLQNCKKGIQLWNYQPQKIIRTWKLSKTQLNSDKYPIYFQDEQFIIQIFFKNSVLNSRQLNQNYLQSSLQYQNKQRKSEKTLEKQKCNKINSQKNENLSVLQKKLKQNINMRHKNRGLYAAEYLQNRKDIFYEINQSFYSSKNNSTSYSQDSIYKNGVRPKRKLLLDQNYNIQASYLYGFDQKQIKVRDDTNIQRL